MDDSGLTGYSVSQDAQSYFLDLLVARANMSNDERMESTSVASSPEVANEPEMTGSKVSLEEIFPILGPPPAEWIQALEELLAVAHSSYLTGGSDSARTRQLCARIPALLNACTQIISRVTGAYISARAVWPEIDDRRTLNAYSTLSNRASGYIVTEDTIEEISYLIHQICYGAGPFLERRSASTYPVIYTNEDAQGRPLLCPPHPCLQQRIQTLIDWFSGLRIWQGVAAFTWAQLIAAVESGEKLYFDPSRAVVGFPHGKPLQDWTQGQVDNTYGHIFTLQTRYYSGDESAASLMFQWLEGALNEPLRTTPAGPISGIYREESAAYYLATARHGFRDDAYMSLSSLPGRWFNQSFFERFSHIITPSVRSLLQSVELNEKLEQPQRSPQSSDPALLKAVVAAQEDPEEFLNKFKIPTAVYDYDNDEHSQYEVRTLVRFVTKSNQLVSSDHVSSGRCGIYGIGLSVLGLSKLMDDMKHDRIPLSSGQFKLDWGTREGIAIESMIRVIVDGVNRIASANLRPEISQDSRSAPWRPTRILFEIEGEAEPRTLDWPLGDWGTDAAVGGRSSMLRSPEALAHVTSISQSTMEQAGSGQIPPDNQQRAQHTILDEGTQPTTDEQTTWQEAQSTERKAIDAELEESGAPAAHAAPAAISTLAHAMQGDSTLGTSRSGKSSFNLYASFMKKETAARSSTQKRPASKPNTPTEQHASSARASTIALPEVEAEALTKQSQSADAKSRKAVSAEPTSGNALGLQITHPTGSSTPAHKSKAPSLTPAEISKASGDASRAVSLDPSGSTQVRTQHTTLRPVVTSGPSIRGGSEPRRTSELPTLSPEATSAPAATHSTGVLGQTGMFSRAAGALMGKPPTIGLGRPGTAHGAGQSQDRAVSSAPSRRATRATTAGAAASKRGLGEEEGNSEGVPGSPTKRARAKSKARADEAT